MLRHTLPLTRPNRSQNAHSPSIATAPHGSQQQRDTFGFRLSMFRPIMSLMEARRPPIAKMTIHVRFSNRPFGVKRFQTIHQHSVDVAHGLVLLFGIGAKALPSWDSKTRRNNLWDGLAVSVTAGPSGHTISPHPSSREGHHSTAQWNSSFLLLD